MFYLKKYSTVSKFLAYLIVHQFSDVVRELSIIIIIIHFARIIGYVLSILKKIF